MKREKRPCLQLVDDEVDGQQRVELLVAARLQEPKLNGKKNAHPRWKANCMKSSTGHSFSVMELPESLLSSI